MENDITEPNEMLMAMAYSVIEKQPLIFNPIYTIKDPPVKKILKLGGKPPREVFYRNTLTFMTKIPLKVPEKICSSKHLCSGDTATIICHSCSIYDLNHAFYYCSLCFQARHPWYRLEHIYTEIENDESILHTLKVAHRVSEVSRYQQEGQLMLKKLKNEEKRLKYISDDENIDNNLRIYGRKAVALEEYLISLRNNLQGDINSNITYKLVKNKNDCNNINNHLNEKNENNQENDRSDNNNDNNNDINIDMKVIDYLVDTNIVLNNKDDNNKLRDKNIDNKNNNTIEDVTNNSTTNKNNNNYNLLDKTNEIDINDNSLVIVNNNTDDIDMDTINKHYNPSSVLVTSTNFEDTAKMIVRIQKIFKGFIARKIVSNMISYRIVRVFDKEIGRGSLLQIVFL